jgi:hypothetical protein
MKKIFQLSLAFVAALTVVSCSDKDESSYTAENDRLMRPIFRTNLTVSNGSNDPYLCHLVGGEHGNSIQLYWSRVEGAQAYQLRASISQSVATGTTERWDNPKYLEMDTIIDGNEVDALLLQDLQYSKTYRFSIRALADKNDLQNTHNSQWFGIGDLRHNADYCAIKTGDREDVPGVITGKSNITKTGFTISLDRSTKQKSRPVSQQPITAQINAFKEMFTAETDGFGNEVWKVDYLVVEASGSNPEATVPEEFKKIDLTGKFDANGLANIDITGLDSNSVYNVYAYDAKIAQERALVYAQYNLDITVRTKGDPFPPEAIVSAPQDTMHYTLDDGNEYSIDLPIAATPIQPKLEDFMRSNVYAENQVFYLEGGKEYFVTSGMQIYKGFKLATNPDDIAAGKGRAKIYLYHQDVLDISKGTSPSPAFFMLGRRPEGSENPMVTIDIDKIEISDIDFAIPMARNIGDGDKIVTNSYFMNMYSDGMGAVVEGITIKNCSFQGLVGGFYRVQANYGVRIKEFTVDNVDFYNGGYYNAAGRRYNWFHANPEANPKINIWEKFTMRNCTIFDNPLGHLFNHNKQEDVNWGNDIHYNITLENNTFVNFNTCAVGNSYFFNMRWIPGGSSFTMKRNLFVLTRQAGDELRTMVQAGCDIRTVNGDETVYLDFEDNYSTNDYLFGEVKDGDGNVTKEGQIFSNTSSAFDFKSKNTFGALSKNYTVFWANETKTEEEGMAGLTVKVAPISATDLMVQPNPPHILTAAPNHYDHQCDGIDGTVTNPDAKLRSDYVSGMVDLHFKDKNNILVEKNVGNPKWRQ